MTYRVIDSCESLEQRAVEMGVLPFFANPIEGFSIEEMAAPGMLFGGNKDDDGCWEWKGPVIRNQTTAYGKFFRRKAGFVSVELLPDFLNYRRDAYPIQEGTMESDILALIESREGLSSTELRRALLSSRDSEGKTWRRSALEAPLQRLQMAGRILIADFEYKYSARGERYGWGVAVYSTPEIWLGIRPASGRTPEESFSRIVDALEQKLPGADRKKIERLLS